MHRGDTLIKEETKCSLHCAQYSSAKFNWPDSLCRADLGQGHRSIHNQTTGHQNHHGPHSCHKGPHPHRGRPLLRRWVSLFVSTYDITHQPPKHSAAGALSLGHNLGHAEVEGFHWFDSWGAMWWLLPNGWRDAEGCVSSLEAWYWHCGAFQMQESLRKSAVSSP